jgi:hypothetical protein
MTISKLSQLERDYARVTRTRPWLIPTRWQAPRVYEPLPGTSVADQLEAVEDCAKLINTRLRRAYQQRKRRALALAMEVVRCQLAGLPPPRAHRTRERRGNRAAPGSLETLRRRMMQRARAMVDPRYRREYEPGVGWGTVKSYRSLTPEEIAALRGSQG